MDQGDEMMYDEIWQIVPSQLNSETNCNVPKYMLNDALRSNDIKLPLLFKITNLHTNKYAICAADSFHDTEEGERLAMVSPIIIDFLQIFDIASIEMINKSPDLIPEKAKFIFLEPQDELFHKLKDPQKTLEKCFKNSYIMGQDYLIPIKLRPKTIYIKVSQLLNENGQELKFANINNIDLNVEFLPLPEHLRSKTQQKPVSSNVIRKKLALKKTENNDEQNHLIEQNHSIEKNSPIEQKHEIPPPIYDPQKRWVPFCGWGRVLSTGAYVPGSKQ
jgi:hypothetical protein